MSLPSIGFVGVGRMGANMARRLKEVGYPIVAVYDARPETAAGVAAELEANAAERVSEVSRLAEVEAWPNPPVPFCGFVGPSLS